LTVDRLRADRRHAGGWEADGMQKGGAQAGGAQVGGMLTSLEIEATSGATRAVGGQMGRVRNTPPAGKEPKAPRRGETRKKGNPRQVSPGLRSWGGGRVPSSLDEVFKRRSFLLAILRAPDNQAFIF
jgi:hypothetical protein